MGFSRGGTATLYSAMNRLYDTLGLANNLRFAAHLAFYATTYLDDTDVSGKPIRILQGSLDDYSPIAPCRAYVERLTKAHKDVQLIEYPGAYHVFDALAFRKSMILTGAPSLRHCRLVEGNDHQIMNSETRKPFTYGDTCVEKSPTLAYNEAASRRAHAFVRSFLTKLFKIKQ